MDSKTAAPNVLLAGSAVVTVSLGWYLWVLLGRTGFLTRATSLGSDVIVGFHLLGISAVAASALALRHVKAKHGLAVFALAASCAVEMAFFGMNLFGKVWQFEKGQPESLYAAVVQLMRGTFR